MSASDKPVTGQPAAAAVGLSHSVTSSTKQLLIIGNQKRKYEDESGEHKRFNKYQVSVIDACGDLYCLNFPDNQTSKLGKRNFVSITKLNTNLDNKTLSCSTISRIYAMKPFPINEDLIQNHMHAPSVPFAVIHGSQDGSRLTINAKVEHIFETRTGPGWQRKDLILSDRNASDMVTFKVWNEHVDTLPQISKGQTITAENIEVSTYRLSKYVHTTLDTVVKVTQADDRIEQLECVIIGLNVQADSIDLLTADDKEFTAEKRIIPNKLWDHIPGRVVITYTTKDMKIKDIKICENTETSCEEADKNNEE